MYVLVEESGYLSPLTDIPGQVVTPVFNALLLQLSSICRLSAAGALLLRYPALYKMFSRQLYALSSSHSRSYSSYILNQSSWLAKKTKYCLNNRFTSAAPFLLPVMRQQSLFQLEQHSAGSQPEQGTVQQEMLRLSWFGGNWVTAWCISRAMRALCLSRILRKRVMLTTTVFGQVNLISRETLGFCSDTKLSSISPLASLIKIEGMWTLLPFPSSAITKCSESSMMLSAMITIIAPAFCPLRTLRTNEHLPR